MDFHTSLKFHNMKPFRLTSLAILFFVFALNSLQAQTEQPVQSVPVPNTEQRSFYSKVLGQDIILMIKLPSRYYSSPQKQYHVWYFTDGNRSFPLVANIASIFEMPLPQNPELVIVSIAYKIRDMADWGAWRTRDLTPTNVASIDTSWSGTLQMMTGRKFDVKTGGAGKFLDCIEQEIIPFIESNYRVMKTGRGLGGYSYGGLFSLYALFTRPGLFSTYYAGSPSIDYDKGFLFSLEKKSFDSHRDLNAKLFMSAGGEEDSTMVTNMKRMAAILESRKYTGLSVNSCVFPDETHATCIPASVMRAFEVLYYKNSTK